jgi:hypothetical protein
MNLQLVETRLLCCAHFPQVSVFGKSMWEFREERGQFYLHQFLPGQPGTDVIKL